jgi:hypothetical protein
VFVFAVDESDYVYLLALYLGDGCLSETARTFQLRISLDAAYPGIVLDCAEALERISPNKVTIRKEASRSFQVYSGWKLWPVLFPQHGRGRKHERPIVLAPWQRELVGRHRGQFIRGLIHSDGCRTVNRFKMKLPSGRVAEYEYVRYFFSNMAGTSADCSVRSATSSTSGPRSPTTATSASRIATASRSTSASSARSSRRRA